jgi:hypothetical protein
MAIKAHDGYRLNVYADAIATAQCLVEKDSPVMDLDSWKSQLTWFWFDVSSESHKRALHTPLRKHIIQVTQREVIAKHAENSLCLHRCPAGCNAWLASKLVHTKLISSRLSQFVLLGRTDRIKFHERRHLTQHVPCKLCEEGPDSLHHFLFECEHMVSQKMRRKICKRTSSYIATNPSCAQVAPALHTLLRAFNNQLDLTNDTQRHLTQVLFGFIHTNNCIFSAFSKSDKATLTNLLKFNANTIHKAWFQRNKHVHNPNHIPFGN